MSAASPTDGGEACSAGSAQTLVPPPESPAQLAARLVAAHEHVASLLEATLRPLSPMRQQLSPEQAAELLAQLNAARRAIEHARAMGASGGACAAAVGVAVAAQIEAEASSGNVGDASGSASGRSSVASGRTESSRSRAVERSKSGPADLTHDAATRAAATKTVAATVATSSRSEEAASKADASVHYTDKIRQFSRGGSDSRLNSQPARIKSLRQGLRRMFVSAKTVAGGSASNLFSRRSKSSTRSDGNAGGRGNDAESARSDAVGAATAAVVSARSGRVEDAMSD